MFATQLVFREADLLSASIQLLDPEARRAAGLRRRSTGHEAKREANVPIWAASYPAVDVVVRMTRGRPGVPTGEITDAEEAGTFLLGTINDLLVKGERRDLVLSNRAIIEYKTFKALGKQGPGCN